MLEKFIIDTDIGDDIDDAYALTVLSYKLNSNLIGITTVFKNAFERAKIASYLLKKFGTDIPVYAGLSKPIKEPIKFLQFETPSEKPHISQLIPIMEKEKVNEKSAIDFILESAEKEDNLTIVEIGPMTNLAAAFKKNPATFKKIKRIVAMGGCFASEFAEWNVRCDPEAVDLILNSDVPVSFVGIDITKHTDVNEDFINTMSKLEKLDILDELTHLYMNNYCGKRMPTMHDPLVVVSLFENIIDYEDVKLKVCLEGSKRGMLLKEESGFSAKVAVKADYDKFMMVLISTLVEFNKFLKTKEKSR